jgi:hypothetical protein
MGCVMGGRIRLTGRRDADGRLVSVTFSNRSGGSLTLPVRDDHPTDDEPLDATTTDKPQGTRQVMTLRDWLKDDAR